MIKPIETHYKGYRFRSRLEARWAVFLDRLGCDWDYEPEGFDLGDAGWYLPDFFVRMSPAHPCSTKFPGAGYWVEIKGVAPTADELEKLRQLALQTGHHAYLFAGKPGDERIFAASRVLKYSETVREVDARVLARTPLEWMCSSAYPRIGDYNGAVRAARSARFGKGGRG